MEDSTFSLLLVGNTKDIAMVLKAHRKINYVMGEMELDGIAES